MGDYGFNLQPNTVQELMAAKRRKDQALQVQKTSNDISATVDQRQQDRAAYQTATDAPVKPQKWYQRLAQGAFLGIASKAPGESLGESVGRGVGFGAASAIASTGHGNIVKNIRNQELTKDYQQKDSLSGSRLKDLGVQQGVANQQYQQGLSTDREDRLQRKGIASIDEGQSKLQLKQQELEQKAKDNETNFQQKGRGLDLREREVGNREKHTQYQEKLGDSRLHLDQSKASEVERHNKEMEGKGQETDQYIINLVGSKGEVKPMSIKVPKGEDPETYVRTIKQGSVIAVPKDKAAIDQRNKSALDKLIPKKAGESKGLMNLINK